MSALASDTQLKTLNTNHFSGQFKSWYLDAQNQYHGDTMTADL